MPQKSIPLPSLPIYYLVSNRKRFSKFLSPFQPHHPFLTHSITPTIIHHNSISQSHIIFTKEPSITRTKQRKYLTGTRPKSFSSPRAKTKTKPKNNHNNPGVEDKDDTTYSSLTSTENLRYPVWYREETKPLW